MKIMEAVLVGMVHFALWDNHDPMGSRVLCLGIKLKRVGLGGRTWIVNLISFRNTWAIQEARVWMNLWMCFQSHWRRRGDPPRMWWHRLPGWGLGLNKEGEGRKSAENLLVPTLCFLVSTEDKQSTVPCSQWGNVSLWTASQNKASLALPFCQVLKPQQQQQQKHN